MPITKADFDEALALDAAMNAAAQEADTQQLLAKQTRAALRVLIATWRVIPPSPTGMALVEHEGKVYRVTEADIRPLSPESTV